MYLENSEQGKVSGEGEQSTEVMLAEQYQLPKETEGADLPSPSKRSAEPGIEAHVEYTEQTVVSRELGTSILCVEHFNMNKDETESCTYCNGHSESFEECSASDGFFESDQIIDKCETSGLSQPFDECAQHCECFKPCKSSEHSVNHSLASKCSPCCEHCAEHLKLFQQCKPSNQQFDFEPDKLAVNCYSFGQCEMSDFIPECTEHLELPQQYEPSEQQREYFDCEPDTSTKDSEQCEMTGFTPNISDSVDSLDCDIELCEYDEIQNQSECTDDEDEESCPPEQNETERIDEGFGGLKFSHFDAPAHVYFDESEDVSFASECCETLTGENYQQANKSTDHCKMCETDDSETSQEYEQTQQCATSEKCNSDFFTEEDGSSDCSSVETKSFKTCPDGSIPSDPCTDSSGESEKGAQEDSGDEQTQWESFEDDEEIEQSNINGCNEDKKKTPTVDVVIEDYFDLFDRADYYGHTFAQKRHYISCFDGGDINARLYLEEVHSEVQKLAKNAYKCKEINEEMYVEEIDTSFNAPEEACEDTYEENPSLRDDTSSGSRESEKQSDDWIIESDSSLAEDEVECEEAEKDEGTFDGEACVFYSHVSEIRDEIGADFSLSNGHGENVCAPFANDISVEGDAYEDEVSYDQNYGSLGDNTSTINHLQTTVTDYKKENKAESEDKEFLACSEMEPYWSLADHEENEEMCEPGVEEYYTYQIKSIQSSIKQALSGFIKKESSYNQIIHGKSNEDVPGNEGEDALLSPKETELQAHAQSSPANCSVVEKTTNQQTSESDDDCGSSEISKEFNPPSDIIHSVASELVKTEGGDAHNEQSRDSEEEQSDDESSESCECEYCFPPIEQVLYIIVLKLRNNVVD